MCLLALGFRQANLCLQQKASSFKTPLWSVHTVQNITHTVTGFTLIPGSTKKNNKDEKCMKLHMELQ